MIVLDTDLLSVLRGSADTPFRRWVVGLADATCVSIYSVTEIQAGSAMVRERDRPFAEGLSGWLDEITTTATILPVDLAAAKLLGDMMAIAPLQRLEGDLVIAPTAMAASCPLATLNLRHFRLIARHFPALAVIDPLEKPRQEAD